MQQAELSNLLGQIAKTYPVDQVGKPFSSSHPVWSLFHGLQRSLLTHPLVEQCSCQIQWSAGKGKWAKMPWLVILAPSKARTTQAGLYIQLLFAQDMSGVYVLMTQGVQKLKQRLGTSTARKELEKQARKYRKQYVSLREDGFKLDNEFQLAADNEAVAKDYQQAVIAYQFIEFERMDEENIQQSLAAVLKAYLDQPAIQQPEPSFDYSEALQELIQGIRGQAFIYEPWQIAAFITAARTKPFLILAGVSGTGKTKLPQLVAHLTQSQVHLTPIRPDWTDSSEVLGYRDLEGNFRPGFLLKIIEKAYQNPNTLQICILDEMNLARVEYYFSEVLSYLENRRPAEHGGYQSDPVLSYLEEPQWNQLGIPPNLLLVGTVNMDETTHHFSRKVLDRAFILELSEINFGAKPKESSIVKPIKWPIQSWFGKGLKVSDLQLNPTEEKLLTEVNEILTELNQYLRQEQFQVAYRLRDEIFLFVLHAQELLAHFQTQQGLAIDPLDLALQMKILPRLSGSRQSLQTLLFQLLGWAYNGEARQNYEEVAPILKQWTSQGKPFLLKNANYPILCARLSLMTERLMADSYTSFWL